MKYIVAVFVALLLAGCSSENLSRPMVEHMAQDALDDRISHESPPIWQVWASDMSRLDVTGRLADCSSCHGPEYCSTCHGSAEVYTQGRFKKALIKEHWGAFHLVHPVSDRSHLNLCLDCHTSESCANCHEGIGKPSCQNWSSIHAELSRQNLRSCEVCHLKAEVCIVCHSARSGPGFFPHPVNWNNVKNSVDSSACAVCH
jgi:hypothetical protein